MKAHGPLEAPASAAAADVSNASLMYHMRGNARANAADLLHNWLQDFEASGVRHTPQSLTALTQVRTANFLLFSLSLLLSAAAPCSSAGVIFLGPLSIGVASTWVSAMSFRAALTRDSKYHIGT